MAAIGKTLENEEPTRRGAFISWRRMAIASFLIIALSVGILITNKLRGSDVDRGTRALIEAFSKQRLIEPRLSGGFKGGEFRPSRDGTSDIKTGELERARGLIMDAVAKGESRAELAYARLLLSESEKLPEALKYLRQAAASAPESAEMHNDMGVLLIQRGKLEDALDEFEAALKNKPNMPEPLFNHALCYERLLLRDAASAEYGRLLEIEQDASWLDEIKQRQREVSAPLAPQKKEADIVTAFDAALAAGNIDEANRIEDQNCEIIVRHAYVACAIKHLKEWLAGNNEEAERALSEIELIGKRFAETRSDTCILDFASYLRKLPDAERENELKLIGKYTEEERLYRSQKTDEARAVFEELSRGFAERGNDAFQCFSTSYSAILQYNAGNLAASINILKQAQSITEKHSWPYHRARVLEQLAIAHSRLGRDALAIKYCEEALRSGHDLMMIQAKALQYMANAYGHLGDLNNRLATLRESTGMYLTSVPTLREIASNYLDIAELYRARGNHRLALLYASESLDLSDRAKDDNRAAEVSSFIAVEHARFSEFEQARQFLSRAFGYLDKLEIDKRAHAEQFVLTSAAQVEETRGDHLGAAKLYSDAEAVLEKTEGKAILLIRLLRARAEAYAQARQFEKARLDLERAVTLIEGYRENITQRENRSSFLDASQSVFDQIIKLDIGAFKLHSEAFNWSEQSRARTLLDEFSVQLHVSAASKQLKPLRLKSVQQALPDDVRLLTYSVTNEGTFLFLVTRTAFEIAESPATTEILDRLVQDFVSGLRDIAPVDELNEKARTLYQYLIAPVEKQIGDGKTLCIAPDKALHFLPFAALVDQSGRYLVDSCLLTYTPSASALALCIEEARAKPARKDETILAVGNPYFNRDEFPQLEDLPEAEREASESATLYLNSAILTGREATEDRVKTSLKDCDVAHLAVHCLVRENSPWLAALVLASTGHGARGPSLGTGTESSPDDGLLQLNEIYGIVLPRTRLVVLSACQSGLGQYYRGEGMVSLVRPFLALRVPTVVASLWKVNSEGTSVFMINFHRERKSEHRTTGDALRAAQITMRHTDPYQHPYYWAPFIAVGSNN